MLLRYLQALYYKLCRGMKRAFHVVFRVKETLKGQGHVM